MHNIITVTPTDSFSCSFPIDGADAAVLVDLNQWPSLAALEAALSALSAQASASASRHRNVGPWRLRDRSEPTAPTFGPYGAGAWEVGAPYLRFFPCRTGWNATLVAAAEKQGPAVGPVGAAIVVNADAPGFAAAISTAVAGALQGLAGRLP
ncbi:MAG: hypothetical protein IPG91_11205 [Ideonella sp.]|nr:hypothetical protein [Ideonella sp.]